ncbi:hypothetical protein AB1286_20675, partial [Trinickia sp. NRRL B-1857]
PTSGMAEDRTRQAVDRLTAVHPTGDDTDAFVAERLGRARRRLAAAHAAALTLAAARPIVDCENDPDFGESCDVWPADPGYAAGRALARASERGDKQAALRDAREAVAAAPDSAQHRVELVDVLDDAGRTGEAGRRGAGADRRRPIGFAAAARSRLRRIACRQ